MPLTRAFLLGCAAFVYAAMFSTAEIDAIFASGDQQAMQMAFTALTHPYYTFQPRPDNRAAFDEQSGFVNSRALVSWAVGGNGSGKTLCAAHKCARFVLKQQAPPDKDTPFWIIANSLDQVCQTTWFQKLRNIIPADQVDWKRVIWYREKRGWPLSIPLKPWPGREGEGKNWVLEFKSYEQGREQMQAAAIGGAWFTEQFPWEVFEEVLRGCREHMYPGSVFADFTPIDPAKSVELEAIYELWLAGDPAYRDYGFFRMNTEECLKAGQIKQEWYDTFFGLVSDEMADTRRTGAFASYEGAIFPSFDPRIHVDNLPRKPDGRIDIPRAVFFRRTIDWGASVEHPFVCLWFYRDAAAQYVFFDEYYDTAQTKTSLDHIAEIKKRHAWLDSSLWYGPTFADPSRPDMIRLFGSQGIPVTPADNRVYDGIEMVRRLLGNSGMGPRILIDKKNCPNLCRTMRTYRWKKSSGKGVNPAAARPEPLKFDDDPVDALRYGVMSDANYSGSPQMKGYKTNGSSVPGMKLAGGRGTAPNPLGRLYGQR